MPLWFCRYLLLISPSVEDPTPHPQRGCWASWLWHFLGILTYIWIYSEDLVPLKSMYPSTSFQDLTTDCPGAVILVLFEMEIELNALSIPCFIIRVLSVVALPFFFFLFDWGLTAVLRIFHLYRANRSSKVGENRSTRRKTTWPSISRTWLSHMWPELGSNHNGEKPNGLRVNSLIH